MACMKVGSKSDAFQRKGQAWFCTTGLPSDVVVEVGEISFHLHKFPLLSRSGFIEKLIAETSQETEDGFVIKLPNIPGGAKSFELVVKFCYGVKLELTSSNVVYLRCASEYLEMTEDYGEGNLISLSEIFLNQVVLRSWKDSIKALQTCNSILSHAEQLGITKRCIESLSMKTSTDPKLFGWPGIECGGGPIQSPGGGVLWNGISTGARPKTTNSDWWYEDASNLSLPLYKRLISSMETRGVKREIIAGSLCFYAKKYLPALHRREDATEPSTRLGSVPLSEEDQKNLLQELDRLIPNEKGIVSTKFLFGLLRTAMILRANPVCVSNLEKRIGFQLDEASLEDLLMPNYSYTNETLYNIECVQRVLNHFLANEEATCGGSPIDEGGLIGSPCLTPITMVAKVVDGFLAEVAPDVNLKLPKFQALAAAVPEYARPLDDGLYRAIDIYLKSHPWLSEPDREQVCRLMDCQKLSLEACTHAAQNERLPLRTIVQVLFFEQLQLRTSIATCFLVSDNLDGTNSRHLLPSGPMAGPTEDQVMKVGMDSMRTRVSELERECSSMRSEIEKLGRTKGLSAWENMTKRLGFGFKVKSQMCSAQEGSVSNRSDDGGKAEKRKHKSVKDRKNLSVDG